jgi:hypothetical protein
MEQTTKRPEILSALFSHEYMNGKALYMYLTGKIPSVVFMNEIDPFDGVAAFREKFEDQIEDWHNEAVWNHDKQTFTFENAFFVMKNNVIVQFGHNFVHMMHSMNDWDFIESVAQLLAPFRKPADDDFDLPDINEE